MSGVSDAADFSEWIATTLSLDCIPTYGSPDLISSKAVGSAASVPRATAKVIADTASRLRVKLVVLVFIILIISNFHGWQCSKLKPVSLPVHLIKIKPRI